jgi:hypothetical protein
MRVPRLGIGYSELGGNAMNGDRESKGDPVQKQAPPESTLAAPAPPAGHEEMKTRVDTLEMENRELKARVRALELTVDRLDRAVKR